MTTCTVPIVGGPNLHLIERNLMVPRIELAYSDPVEFKIVLPFESKLLSYQPTEASRVVYVRLALTAMKRLDDSLLMLEGWDACKKFFNPLMEPPFKITSYNLSNRTGFIQISSEQYKSLRRHDSE